MGDPKHKAFCTLCHQLVYLGRKLNAAQEKGDEDAIKKYRFQIKATVIGMLRVSEE
ncbi:MAG: hypothetical protein PHN39_02195 [Candidatus Pacebacteria bacterium]|nr:hypothetical protein [Candidatus Paceibacterota bacterium]